MSKKRALDFNYQSSGSQLVYAAMDCDRFIAEIEARPGIWQISNPEHKNKFRVRKLWDEVQSKFPELKVDDLKKRWKNLKDTYRKELKRLPQHRPGVPDDNFTSGWRYYDGLQFLRQQFSFQRREQDDSNQAEPDKYTEACSQSPDSPESSKSEDEAPNPPATSKRKEMFDVRAELIKIERKKIKILEEEVARSSEYTKSDNYHFLMSLLPEMDKLGPLQKMRLRAKISQAVFDELSMGPFENQHSFNDETMGSIQNQIDFEPDSPVVKTDVSDVVKEEAINIIMYE